MAVYNIHYVAFTGSLIASCSNDQVRRIFHCLSVHKMKSVHSSSMCGLITDDGNLIAANISYSGVKELRMRMSNFYSTKHTVEGRSGKRV